MLQTLILAAGSSEFIPPQHIAAKIGLPIGLLIFMGSAFMLLWSVYGAKKGGLVYGTAFFAFCTMIGIFWWFGAPGTPQGTAMEYFPGQNGATYAPKWYPMEPGSERAGFFPITNSYDNFESVAAYVGAEGTPLGELEKQPRFAFIHGDVAQAGEQMLAQYLPHDEQGSAILGATRRQKLQDAAGDPQQGETRATPFFTAQVDETRVATARDGTLVAAAKLTTFANFATPDGTTRQVPVEQGTWFAFRDPGARWFPQAVWTGISLLAFIGCLLGLDRIEQREKREQLRAEEPERVRVSA